MWNLTVKKPADNLVFSLWTKILSLIDPRPYQPTGPTNLLHRAYGVAFPGVKRPARGVDHPHLSSAEVKERVELYLYSPVPSRHFTVRPLPLPLHCGTFSFITWSAIVEFPLHPVRRPSVTHVWAQYGVLPLHMSEHCCCALPTACRFVDCALTAMHFALFDGRWIRQV
jgi:hypothetical protein